VAGVRLSGGEGVAARLDDAASRPVWMLDDTQERATHEVTFGFDSGAGESAAEPGPTTHAISSPSRTTARPSAPGPNSKISRLLGPEAGWGAVGVWCLAVLLGAVHAAQPGHGKTLVAAASLSAHRPGAGVIVGLATTATHMASVLAVAAVLWFTRSTRYGAIQATLTHAAGFVIAAIGLYRLGRAIGGHPSHWHDLEPEAGGRGEGLRGLLALGVSGGLVPCWDAVLLILLADLAGRLPWGIVLLAGFSLGMAAVLTAIGLAVGRARRWLSARGPTDRLERILGLGAGVALTALGGYLWVAS
jgi:ABC-type nickel/cobalt efflux system permease component RcnA